MAIIMTFPFRVHIHLGAHKTATTFIQNWLMQNTALLRGNQVAYIPLDTLRKRFSPCFLKLVRASQASSFASASELADKIRGIIKADIESSGFDFASTRLLVLSEENLLGVMGPLTQTGVLYPALKMKMHCLAAVFEGCDVQAFMAIRNYQEFYPSAYAETLRGGHIKPFGRFMDNLDLSGNSWLGVVQTVEAALGPLKLWPYESFRANVGQILGTLLGIQVTPDMIRKQAPVRPSLTQKGLEVVMRSQGNLSAVELKRLVNLLSDRMVFEPPDAPIMIPDSLIRGQLDAKYGDELEQLAGRFIVNVPGR